MNTKILERIGKKIKSIRKNSGLTQEKLAEKINVHPTYIGKIESGKNNPSILLLYKLSKALKIKLSDLFDLD